MDHRESEVRSNKYKLSFIMVHHALSVVASILAITKVQARISILEDFINERKNCEDLQPSHLKCCNLTLLGMPKRPSVTDLSTFQSYFSFPYIFVGSSMFLLTGFWIFFKQQVTQDGSFDVTQFVKSYLIFGWFLQLCNCVLFGTSLDSLETSVPRFLDRLCDNESDYWITQCRMALNICVNTRPFTIYLVIMIVELVLYLPAVVFLHLRYIVAFRPNDHNLPSQEFHQQRHSEDGDSHPTNISQVTRGRRWCAVTQVDNVVQLPCFRRFRELQTRFSEKFSAGII